MATHSSIPPEKSHGQRSLPSYSPWGHRESGVTERTHHVSTVVYLLSVPHLSFIAPIDRLPASTRASTQPFPVLKLENICWTGSPESSSCRHVGLRDIDVLVLVQDMTSMRPWEVGCQVRVTGARLLQPSLQCGELIHLAFIGPGGRDPDFPALVDESGRRLQSWPGKAPSGHLWADPHPEGNTAAPWGQDSEQKASLAPKGEHHHMPASQTAACGHVNAWPGLAQERSPWLLQVCWGLSRLCRLCPESPRVLYPDGLACGIHTRVGVCVRRRVPA